MLFRSGLDEQTERQALGVLAQWAHDKTVVVVTHRLQVLPMVNRVVVVDNGRVIIDGPRDAVIAKLRENEERQAQAVQAQAQKAAQVAAEKKEGKGN